MNVIAIKSFKAQPNIKLKHMQENDKKVGKFQHLQRNWIIMLIKKGRNRIMKLIYKGGKVEYLCRNWIIKKCLHLGGKKSWLMTSKTVL